MSPSYTPVKPNEERFKMFSKKFMTQNKATPHDCITLCALAEEMPLIMRKGLAENYDHLCIFSNLLPNTFAYVLSDQSKITTKLDSPRKEGIKSKIPHISSLTPTQSLIFILRFLEGLPLKSTFKGRGNTHSLITIGGKEVLLASYPRSDGGGSATLHYNKETYPTSYIHRFPKISELAI
jgi:hypothetical protein